MSGNFETAGNLFNTKYFSDRQQHYMYLYFLFLYETATVSLLIYSGSHHTEENQSLTFLDSSISIFGYIHLLVIEVFLKWIT